MTRKINASTLVLFVALFVGIGLPQGVHPVSLRGEMVRGQGVRNDDDLRNLPGERLRQSLGEITVESLNGYWIFSTIAVNTVNNYWLTTMRRQAPFELITGRDQNDELPVIVFPMSVLDDSKETASFREEHGSAADDENSFVLIDLDDDGCDVFFIYRVKPHTVKGEHFRSRGSCLDAMKGSPNFVTGGRRPDSFRKPSDMGND